MASKKEKSGAMVKVRVLYECSYGKPNDVVEISDEHLADAKAQGYVDDDPNAVSYAESLK